MHTQCACVCIERELERDWETETDRMRTSWGYHFMEEEPEVIKLNPFLVKMTINLNNQRRTSINWPVHVIKKWCLHVK